MAPTQAAITDVLAARSAQRGPGAGEFRNHGAVLEIELVLFRAVPVDLGVDIAAVQFLGAGDEVVAEIPGLGQVGVRKQIQQLHHRTVQAAGGDDVRCAAGGNHGTARAIGIPCIGIKDHPFPKGHGATFGGGHQDRMT